MISAAARSSSMPSMSVDLVGGGSARSSRVRTPRGQGVGGGFVHAVQRQQVVGRLVFLQLFLDRQRVVQQRVAGTRAQFLDDVLVEALDRQQLADRHVGDFLDAC
jgi:hypothetical protein